MPTLQFEPIAGPTRAALNKGLRAYNNSHVGPARTKTIAVSLREEGEIVGGALGRIRRGWLHVEYLWMEERHRGRDFGTRLMDMLEGEARSRGAKHAWLDTFSFQARGFYEKRGYRVFGALDDFPPGHAHYWLTKTL